MYSTLDEILDTNVRHPSNHHRQRGCNCKKCRQEQELEVIPNKDDRQIVSTSSLENAPFRYICNIEYYFEKIGSGKSAKTINAYRTMGTGTLIGQRTVLTAGHVIDITKNIAGKSFSPANFLVTPAQGGLSFYPYGFSEGYKVILPNIGHDKGKGAPGTFAQGTVTDLGLIYIKDNLGSTSAAGHWTIPYHKNSFDNVGTSFIRSGPVAYPGNFSVNIAGYPADKPADAKFNCRISPGIRCNVNTDLATKKRECGSYPYKTYNKTVKFIPPSGKLRLLSYLNDTCGGMSGSPVWVKRGAYPSAGGRVLYGVHIGYSRSDSTGNTAVYLLPWVDYLRARIDIF